jgi:hypothetical protein
VLGRTKAESVSPVVAFCGEFDDSWSTLQPIKVLGITGAVGAVKPMHRVLERLAKPCAAHLAEAVQCLRLIFEGNQEGWIVISWRKEIREILSLALQNGDGPKQAAADLINRLAAAGYMEFADLL